MQRCTDSACAGKAPSPRHGVTAAFDTPVGETVIAYDGERQLVVMFGGACAGVGGTETLGFGDISGNGDEWTNLCADAACMASTPTGRWGVAMAYDPVHRATWLFGGTVGRHRQAMAYDQVRNVIVMFGGADDPSTSPLTALGDTWELVAE